MLLEADEFDEAAAGIHATPRGYLAVTAPVLFGKIFVMLAKADDRISEIAAGWSTVVP